MDRVRREVNENKKCNLECICSPDMQNKIAQTSSMSQASESKQTVSMQSAFGFGGIAAAGGLILVLLFALYACKSKLACCMSIRSCCMKVSSNYDMKKEKEAQVAEAQGSLSANDTLNITILGLTLEPKQEKALKNKRKQTTDILRKKVDKELKSGNTKLDTIVNTSKNTLLEGKLPGKKFDRVAQPGSYCPHQK